MISITAQDKDEIIAIQFDDSIYFGQTAIDKAIALQDFVNIYPRSIFKFMAFLDLDPKWEEYSNYPTLFTITQYLNYLENNSIP